jgi:glycosyltransferase involved in cell wall biosynthesis
MSAMGVVAIGRNEGERLRRCLEAMAGVDVTIIYVDSASTDGSVALARALGVEVVELDMTTQFSAARARNVGFERLLEIDPEIHFVQFLDGDCEVAPGWLERGLRTLEDHPEVAVVFGLRNERFPDRSIYNRLADIEWNVPITRGTWDKTAAACGGDAMIRARAFQEVGGYNPSIPAGEEPELCQRLRQMGYSVIRLDANMTWHDSAMLRFHQWVRRQVRTGYGGVDFTTRFGHRGYDPFRRQLQSARLWGLCWPLALIVMGGLAAFWGGSVAGLACGLLALFWPVQAIRIAARNRTRAGSFGAALAYGVLTMVGKFFQMTGQGLFLRDRLAGRHSRLIEYKFAAPLTEQTAS